MTGSPSLPKSVAAAKTLIGLQLVTLFCCGVISIGFLMPAFLTVTNLTAAAAIGAGDPASWFILLPWAVEPGVAGAWVLFASHLLNKRDRRGRTAVDIGTATLIALALIAFAISALVAEEVWRSPWLALLTAAPSIGLHVAASACLRSDSAKAWLRVPMPEGTPPLAGIGEGADR
ncbi:hypothetical protein [Glycomyces paridis]|uniref:Uncharacterized protein n=1 Tax=Glycomyces paridis TaxID=2126555 RepID=A0A4S8PG08_9ACTN|nr:hypothetical protein [Glycomyces paridis]THV28302.1 hypothetical protein E9998_11850 [Glycomyces paridis]